MKRPEMEVTTKTESTKRLLSYVEAVNKVRKEKESKEEV